MSDSEHPEKLAFRELEQLIRALGDEMAAWRRRAHEAESRVRAATPAAGAPAVAPERGPDRRAADARVAALECENEELRTRLATARQRTEQLLERVRFLRQQHELGAER
ncbi:MAG TPA: hypothetical protein VFW98_15630 [Gemmatimonadaceae bacterium]|nr:hypothetical protein [Gemmatimonadaceae bacterium]